MGEYQLVVDQFAADPDLALRRPVRERAENTLAEFRRTNLARVQHLQVGQNALREQRGRHDCVNNYQRKLRNSRTLDQQKKIITFIIFITLTI